MKLQTLTTDECDKLLTALIREEPHDNRTHKGLRNYTMALLMLDAGLRVGELVNLLVPDLMFNNEIRTAITILTEKRKGRHERIIPVSARLKQALERMFKLRWSKIYIDDKTYAFYNLHSVHPLTRRQVQRIIKDAAIQSIGRQIHPHILRHTFASRLMRTTPIRIVQQLLGHSSIQSTQIYMHPNGDDLQNAIESLG